MRVNGLFFVLFVLVLVFSWPAWSAGGGGGGSGSGGVGATGSGAASEQSAEQQFQAQILAREAGFGCKDSDSMKERLACRLDKPNKGTLDYLPEECRPKTGKAKLECYDFYESVQPCWLLESDSGRLSCARKIIGLESVSIKNARASCDTLSSFNRGPCIQKLRTQVDDLVRFRLYQLEQKALYFYEENAPKETVLAFMEYMELTKQDYALLETVKEKTDLLKSVQASWKFFVEEIKPHLKEEEA